MIDLRLVRDDPDRVRASQRTRGEDESLVDVLLGADDRRRAAVSRADNLRAEQKTLSRQVGKAAPDERHELLDQGEAPGRRGQVRRGRPAGEADAALREAHLAIPNIVEDGVPPGGETDFVTLESVGDAARDREPARPRRHRQRPAGYRHRTRREGQRRPLLLPDRRRGACSRLALVNLAMEQAARRPGSRR